MSVNFAKVTMMGLTSMGIVFEKTDLLHDTIYISVPEFSEFYDGSVNLKDGEALARRVKEILRADMHNDKLRVFSRIRTGERWTQERGKQVAKEFYLSV